MEEVPLTYESHDDGTLVLRGDVDETSIADLRGRLEDLFVDRDCAAVDLTGVGFLPSAAIGVVVRARARARAAGKDLRLVAATGSRSAQILRMTGVTFEAR